MLLSLLVVRVVSLIHGFVPAVVGLKVAKGSCLHIGGRGLSELGRNYNNTLLNDPAKRLRSISYYCDPSGHLINPSANVQPADIYPVAGLFAAVAGPQF